MSLTLQITEDNFDALLLLFMESSAIDLRDVTFIDPYGMIGILEIGEVLRPTTPWKIIYLPRSEEVLRCFERMHFFRFAPFYFILEPAVTQIQAKYR